VFTPDKRQRPLIADSLENNTLAIEFDGTRDGNRGRDHTLGITALLGIFNQLQDLIAWLIGLDLEVRAHGGGPGLDIPTEDRAPNEPVEPHPALGIGEGDFHHMRVPRKLGEQSETNPHFKIGHGSRMLAGSAHLRRLV